MQLEAFAAASIKVMNLESSDLTMPAALLEVGQLNKTGDVWLYNSNRDDGSPLESHLNELRAFLDAHIASFDLLPRTYTVQAFLGWTPAPGEKLTFDPHFLAQLSRIRASVVFDMYVDEPDED